MFTIINIGCCLVQAGNALDAVRECESLEREGLNYLYTSLVFFFLVSSVFFALGAL